jgi:CRP-like cAMP-binding protein
VDVIVHGILAVQQMDEQGNTYSVASFEKQCIVGGNIVFSSKPIYPHTIVSPQECKIVRIDTGTIFHFCVTYPEFLKLFLKAASDNTLLVNEKLTSIMHHSLRQRLVAYLKSESIRQQTTSVVLPVTKTHLAHIIGVQRTSISRELARMQNEGLLMCEKKKITLDRSIFNRY